MQTNPDTAPLFVGRNLWRNADGSGKSKYCRRGFYAYRLSW